MIVGVFSPAINLCGGAELVALNIIAALREHGHEVILLSDSPIDQKKFKHVFNRRVTVDRQLIFPFRLFALSNDRNVYTNAVQTLILKSKCNVLIDTYSNALLPGVDVAYVHYPLLTGIRRGMSHWRNKVYFLPYKSFLSSRKNSIARKLIFVNSSFTAQAAKAEFGTDPCVLYPPVSNDLTKHTEQDFERLRGSNVVTIARLASEKNLEIIPHIAKLSNREISFTIAGLLSSERVLGLLSSLIQELNVSDRVKIMTNLTMEQSRAILTNSRVFLHPMEKEHFGIAIVEAMSLGCIPVVHNSGGPREFVSPEFRFESIEEAAAKVEKAIDYWSPKQARIISKSAERFDEDNFSKKFIEVFESRFQGDD